MTKVQLTAFAFIVRYVGENGIPPSYDEIAAAAGLHSKSGVSRIVEALVRQGKLRKVRGVARSIEIVGGTGYEIDPQAAAALEAYCARTKAVPKTIIALALEEYFLKRFPEAKEMNR